VVSTSNPLSPNCGSKTPYIACQTLEVSVAMGGGHMHLDLRKVAPLGRCDWGN
jgi:hypothetical protein